MKYLKFLVLFTVMIGLLGGVIYLERETEVVAEFKAALGLNEEARPRGIAFSGSAIGNRKVGSNENLLDVVFAAVFGEGSTKAPGTVQVGDVAVDLSVFEEVNGTVLGQAAPGKPQKNAGFGVSDLGARAR